MRWENLYIRACSTALPLAMPSSEAVAHGLAEAEAVQRLQVVGVAVGDEAPADMAVRAARSAMRRARCGPDDIALILHASSYFQGHDMWAPASYIQHLAVGNRCPAVEVRQTSNGGMAALELAAAFLAGTGLKMALITTGDRFCSPGIDRWRSDPGTVLADGATAAVVSVADGQARVLSLVSVSEPALERMHRGDDPPSVAPLTRRCPVDVAATTRAFLRGADGRQSMATMSARQAESLERCLEEAGTKLSEIDWFVLPHFGRRRLEVNFFRRFGIDPRRTTWDWSRGIGHLGAGDQIAGLNHLLESGLAKPGDRLLLLGVGGGFTWSSAVIEIVS